MFLSIDYAIYNVETNERIVEVPLCNFYIREKYVYWLEDNKIVCTNLETKERKIWKRYILQEVYMSGPFLIEDGKKIYSIDFEKESFQLIYDVKFDWFNRNQDYCIVEFNRQEIVINTEGKQFSIPEMRGIDRELSIYNNKLFIAPEGKNVIIYDIETQQRYENIPLLRGNPYYFYNNVCVFVNSVYKGLDFINIFTGEKTSRILENKIYMCWFVEDIFYYISDYPYKKVNFYKIHLDELSILPPK